MPVNANLDLFLARDHFDLMSAIQALQDSPYQIVVIVDREGRLRGTLTDGDVRRALLTGVISSDPVTLAMNSNPTYLRNSDLVNPLPDLSVRAVPVVDTEFRVTKVIIPTHGEEKFSNQVLLMAGGKGTRLMPYTRDVPKPLVEIQGKALIEMLIESFVRCNFQRFIISVNHMADQIRSRLGDGKSLGVEIEYVHETQPFGTAGSLGLLKERGIETPLLMANADLVTGCRFDSLLEFHEELGPSLTVATRRYDHSVPFGVVTSEGAHIKRVVEKPTWSGQVSAGIYAVSPEVFELVELGERTDMPDLIAKMLKLDEKSVGCFPIHEEWHDVGRPADLEQLRSHFESIEEP